MPTLSFSLFFSFFFALSRSPFPSVLSLILFLPPFYLLISVSRRVVTTPNIGSPRFPNSKSSDRIKLQSVTRKLLGFTSPPFLPLVVILKRQMDGKACGLRAKLNGMTQPEFRVVTRLLGRECSFLFLSPHNRKSGNWDKRTN